MTFNTERELLISTSPLGHLSYLDITLLYDKNGLFLIEGEKIEESYKTVRSVVTKIQNQYPYINRCKDSKKLFAALSKLQPL